MSIRSLVLSAICLACNSFTNAQAVINPSFEQNALSAGQWNTGPITGWTINGSAGLWHPSATDLTISDGANVAWSNGGTISQDVGLPANTTYTLAVSVGRRTGGWTATYTIGLRIGTAPPCEFTASNAAIPAGTVSVQTLTCPLPSPMPPGNLVITLSSAGPQTDFKKVSLVSAGPPQFLFPGSGAGQGFIAKLLSMIPACNAATDGDCSLSVQVSIPAGTPCLTDINGNITCTGKAGTFSIVKTVSLPTPSQTTNLVITAVAGP